MGRGELIAPVIDIFTKQEVMTESTREEIRERIANIAIEQMLLASEKLRLEERLRGNDHSLDALRYAVFTKLTTKQPTWVAF